MSSFEQELFDKEYRRVHSVVSIVLLGKTVALVFGKDLPDRDSALGCGNNLRSFCHGDARIILTLNDQQRFLDLLCVIKWSDAFHEFFDFRIALVPEL